MTFLWLIAFSPRIESNIRRLNSNYSREQFARRLAWLKPNPNSNSHKPNSHKYGNFANFVSIAEYVQHVCLRVAKAIGGLFSYFFFTTELANGKKGFNASNYHINWELEFKTNFIKWNSRITVSMILLTQLHRTIQFIVSWFLVYFIFNKKPICTAAKFNIFFSEESFMFLLLPMPQVLFPGISPSRLTSTQRVLMIHRGPGFLASVWFEFDFSPAPHLYPPPVNKPDWRHTGCER